VPLVDQGVGHLSHGRSPRSDHIPEAVGQGLAVKEAVVVRMPMVGGGSAWGGHADNQDLRGIVQLSTIDMRLDGRVYVDMLGRVYRNHVCNRDIQHAVLLDAHKGTRHRQSNSRT